MDDLGVDAVLLVGLLIVAGVVYLGVRVIMAAFAKAARADGWAWRSFLVVIGAGIIAAPFAFLNALSGLASFHSLGRVLRVRRRAQVAEPAFGDGWSSELETSGLGGDLTAAERAALGARWLANARMEHASVAAFSQLSLQLAALGAPAHLLAATHRAALEEIEHACASFAIARALTGEPHTAGAIPALRTAGDGGCDLVRLAVDSLVDGCLAEGIAADAAARGAERASESLIRRTMTMIARDEAGHATLAWDILAWCVAHGGARVRAAVAARVAVLDREPTPRVPAEIGAVALARVGLIDQAALDVLTRRRIAAVQARANDLLAAAAPIAARAA
jgi:hypothetical protein